MRDLALVASGGAIGAVLRWWLAGAIQGRLTGAFPWGTLAVNAAGCFLIGVVMTVALASHTHGATLRLFLAVGVLGGFTTFSSFSYETLRLWEEVAPAQAALYVATSLGACLAGTAGGLVCGRALVAAL